MKVFARLVLLFVSILSVKSEYFSDYSVDLINTISDYQQTLRIFANNFNIPQVILHPSPAQLDPLTVEPCNLYSILGSDNTSFPEFYLSLSTFPIKFHLVQCQSEWLQFEGSCYIKNLSECISQFLQLSNLSKYPLISIYLTFKTTPRQLATCSENENGCKSCKSSSLCEIPLEGYYLTSLNEAERCKYGCKTCTNTINCTKCFEGFNLSNENNCEECPANCLKCSNTKACEICNYNFFLDLGFCKPCMEGCSICANYTSCGTTNSGYSLTGNGLVIKCRTGCEACNDDECSSCINSYYLSDNICLPCVNNCIKCSSFDSCSQCDSKYYLNIDGVCVECSDNCLTCTSEGCSECEDYYYLTGSGECKMCSSNCDSCEVSTYCSECSGGYFRNNGICQACEDGCEDCSSSSSSDCNICLDIGYYNTTSACDPCESGCKYCQNTNCQYCIQGYYLEDLTCTECSVGCLSCDSSTLCTGCDSEYYLIDNECVKCPEGCLQCYHTTCKNCKTGYYMKNSNCILCSTGCYICSNSNSCESCAEGYYLKSNKCELCPVGSYYCTSEKVSIACINGYYLSGETCEACSEGCKICTSSNCLICDLEYNLNTITEECDLCSNNCEDCKSGFYLKSSDCYACPENCLECVSNTICYSCAEGYKLSSGLCEACESSCETCEPGYYLDDSSICISCLDYCLICTSEKDCSKCQAGYYLDNNICKPCQMYCSECTSLNMCESCIDHFYLDSYKICQSCPDNCVTCSSTECLKCSPTYFNSDGQCEIKKENCLILNEEKCEYCINGFTEKFGECIICESIQVTRTEFAYNFKYVEIEFNIKINQTLTDKENCDYCKQIARTEGDFGSGCTCETDNKIFRVIFGNNYSLTSSNFILVITEKLFTYICYNDQKAFDVQPSYHTLPKQPIPFIRHYPLQSFNCEADMFFFEVNTVHNSYGYSVTYTWFVETNPTNQLVESSALLETSRRLSIDKLLFNNVETQLNVTVIVQNMVKLQGSATAESFIREKEFFVIELDTFSPKTIFFDKSYVLTARVVDTCYAVYPRISWSIKNLNVGLYTTRLKHLLYIPAFGLPFKEDYYYGQVLATGFSGISGYLNFSLSVVYSPLVIVLNTQNCTISTNQNFSIDASKSYNPNTNITEDKYKDLEFSWEYCFSLSNSKCQTKPIPSKQKLLEFNADDLKNKDKYFLHVTLNLTSKNYESATKNMLISISKSTNVNIQLFADKVKYELINFGHKFESTVDLFNEVGVSLNWSVEGFLTSNYKFSGINTPQFYVYRKSLKESEPEFKFNLNAYQNGNIIGSAYMNIIKNIIPICSNSIAVTPLDSKKNKVYTDLFTFYISDCSDTDDDYPLTFRFSVRTVENEKWTTFYQLSVQKSFLEIKCRVFFEFFQASVQYCDSLRSCESSTLNVTATDNKEPSNLLDHYINSTKNKEHVPYYSIMFIKTFYSELEENEYTYIYNDYSLFMRKQKIVNFDVVHISLTFINEIFKLNNDKLLKTRYIRLYFNEAMKVLKKNSDSLTQQNSDVACEIINNVMAILKNYEGDKENKDDLNMEILNLATEFVEKIFTFFSVDRVVGDLIVNSSDSNTQAKIIKYRDTAFNLKNNLNSYVKNYLKSFDFNDVEEDKIFSVIVYKLKYFNSELNIAKVSSSGTYNETTLKYIINEEKLVYVEKDGLSLVTSNTDSNNKCFTFDGTSWEKEENCKVSSDSSIIIVSSDNFNRVESNSFGVIKIENTYAPLILSFIIAFFTLVIYASLAIYEKRQLANPSRRHKKKHKLKTTSAVVTKNTLFLSVFSKDPKINTRHKVLHFFVILNIQLLIEGCFYGFDVIKGKSITVIFGTGFLIPIFTLPYNILATYNIPREKKWMNVLFMILWITQLLLSTLFVSIVNFFKTGGKNAYWIASFGVGLSCELILEIFVMVWKNLREKKNFLELENTD